MLVLAQTTRAVNSAAQPPKVQLSNILLLTQLQWVLVQITCTFACTDNFVARHPKVLDDLANYLDLTFIIESNNRLYTKLYDKRDDFDFHIVNFPFLSSNIPSSPSYGVLYFPVDKICKVLLIL